MVGYDEKKLFSVFSNETVLFLIIRFLIMGMLFGYKVEWKVFSKLVLFLLPKFPIWLGMILINVFRDGGFGHGSPSNEV